MNKLDIGTNFAVFIIITSIVCLLSALAALYKGRVEEKIIGSMISSFIVFHTFERLALLQYDYNFLLSDSIASTFELGVAFWITLRSDEFWTIMIASIFLVKTVSIVAQLFGFSVGVFAHDGIQIAFRFSIAAILLGVVLLRNSNLEREDVAV